MAKIEKSLKKSLKKSKATKRKHEPTDDDAVPDKSVILSEETAKLPLKKQILSKSKRKSTETSVATQISKKRKATSDEGEDEDEEMQQPTLEQLRESEKPENTKAVLTIRQMKKQKLQERLNAQKDESGNKEITRNEEYLEKWKHNRNEWKFEKLRQISIQSSVFDDTKVKENIWPIAVEYLSGSKGAAKEKITKAAEAVIDELDKQANLLPNDESLITSSEKYRRARELLQSFD